jgi:hypothetical protein
MMNLECKQHQQYAAPCARELHRVGCDASPLRAMMTAEVGWGTAPRPNMTSDYPSRQSTITLRARFVIQVFKINYVLSFIYSKHDYLVENSLFFGSYNGLSKLPGSSRLVEAPSSLRCSPSSAHDWLR